jgi:hypothetical protein
MANITVTELGDSIPTIVAATALGALKANTVLAQLVNRDFDNEVASYGQTVNITKRGALSANNKTANAGVTLQTPADSYVAVTLNKHKEVSFLMEDIGRMLSRPDQFAGYIGDAMGVIVEQIETDLAALYSGFSQTIDATAGLDESDFREARRLLNSAKAPLADRVAVLHEDAEKELLGMDKAINTNYAQALGSAAANAWSGRFMGFNVFMDQQIAVAAVHCQNMFFQRNAIVLATRPMSVAAAGLGVQQVVMSENGMGLRVTRSYSPTYLGEQLTIDVLYGVAELNDDHGVVVETAEV